MPNPLLKVKPNAIVALANIGSYPLKHNQRLAHLAMEGISTWAIVEHFMLGIYIHLAGGPKSTAATMFLRLEAESARSAAISGLATKLTLEQQNILRAILKLAKTYGKDRHKLAHWVWGYALDMDDALLLADPRVLAAQEDHPDAFRQAIWVYKERDFLNIIEQNEKVGRLAFQFRRLLEFPTVDKYRELLEAPEMQAILNRQGAPDQSGDAE